MTEQAAVVSRAYEAFARGDIPAVLDTLDPGVRWNVPELLPHGGAFEGREGVGRFFSGLAERWETLDVQPDAPIASGDRVAVTGRARGQLRDGGDADYGFVHVWTVAGGQATEFVEYVDPDGLPSAVGASSRAGAA
jgi:ketosteroid isomerase-like protein